MNEYIIRKWNSVVTPRDIIYHLVDVGFGTTEKLKIMISGLNGTKILIKGNYDFRRVAVSRKRLNWQKYIEID